MATEYRCINCGQIYTSMTQDGYCTKPDCYGIGLLEEAKVTHTEGFPSRSEGASKSIGLCVLLCDASRSMDTAAFAGNPAPRVSLVANAAAAGIADLFPGGNLPIPDYSRPDDAYIAIVAFGARADLIKDRSGKPFLKSVSEIQAEFSTKEDLAGFLKNSLTDQSNELVGRDYTDITKALTLAKEIHDDALKGNLSKYGFQHTFRLIEHDILSSQNTTMTIPGTRTLIYSDGEHNESDGTALSNPFKNEEVSTLMTAFFGNPESGGSGASVGAEQMKDLACVCPIHGTKGYFLISDPQRYPILRGLFRMASGTSGFCPACLVNQRIKGEDRQ